MTDPLFGRTDWPVRCLYTTSEGRCFAVVGPSLFEISSSGTASLIKVMGPAYGPASMTDNGIDLVVSDGSTYWKYPLKTVGVLTVIPNSPKGSFCDFLDGYILMIEQLSGRMWYTPLYSTDTVEGYITAEGSPDNLVGLIVSYRRIILPGTNSTEFWINTVDSAIALQRDPGGFIEYGCAAGMTVAKMSGAVFWLGRDKFGNGVVVMLDGLSPKRISTHALETQIAQLDGLDNSMAYCYQEAGHGFYVLYIPGLSTTWVYDMSTGQWHERATMEDGNLAPMEWVCHTFAFNKHLVGSLTRSVVSEASIKLNDDTGKFLPRIRRLPHAHTQLKWVRYNNVHLDIEVGGALTQGTTPLVEMRLSMDGGQTWGIWRQASMGMQGAYRQRCSWYNCGSTRDFVAELRISDNVPVRIVNAFADIEVGIS